MYIGDRGKFNMIILLQTSIYWTIGINGLLKIIIPLTEISHTVKTAKVLTLQSGLFNEGFRQGENKDI